MIARVVTTIQTAFNVMTGWLLTVADGMNEIGRHHEFWAMLAVWLFVLFMCAGIWHGVGPLLAVVFLFGLFIQFAYEEARRDESDH